MRLFISYAAAIVLAVALLAACNSNDSQVANKSNTNATDNPSTPTPTDGVRRITITELKKAMDAGTVVVVDTRDAASYAQEHITGSINIPEMNIIARAGELPPDKLIVTYCS
jgi:3-mercaptopyruvate sulfurtransferase SseA